MKAVILAGGKGTRLGSLTSDIPKPLVKINGKTILEHQLDYLKKEKISDIIVLTGHLGHKIHEFLGDGSSFGLNIEWVQESIPLGTAGCLAAIKDRLSDEFLLLYGDTILDINTTALMKYHTLHRGIATLVVHPNDHPFDSDLVESEPNGKVISFIPKKSQAGQLYNNMVNAAMYLLSPKILEYIELTNSDFIQDIFPKAMADQQEIFAYQTTEYIKDVGTPERIKKVGDHLSSGLVAGRNLKSSQKAIFIDRDGTINEDVGLLSKAEDFRLISGTESAIQQVNQSEYLAICITNQPVIARNLCSFETLDEIHKKMSALLGLGHAYLDRLYFCPHHPDKGYPEERAAYKINCECRKPGIGMLTRAAQDMNIDLTHSWFIGDSTMDIEAGRRAGCKTILVKTGAAGQDGKYNATPDLICDNLNSAIHTILGNK